MKLMKEMLNVFLMSESIKSDKKVSNKQVVM